MPSEPTSHLKPALPGVRTGPETGSVSIQREGIRSAGEAEFVAGGTRVAFKRILRKAAVLLVVTLVFGWFYGWASPWAFPKDRTPGFGFGVLHGALMPLALPSLAIGKNVDIFAAENSGRPYKIGYICGINLCGLAFFGPLFWRPRPARPLIKTSSDKSQ